MNNKMDEVIELHNYRFLMHMDGGFKNDTWMLYGQVFNHPNYEPGEYIYVSTPKVWVDKNTIQTFSGRLYRLINPNGNPTEIRREIDRVMAEGYLRY